jgi:hypothetical protein
VCYAKASQKRAGFKPNRPLFVHSFCGARRRGWMFGKTFAELAGSTGVTLGSAPDATIHTPHHFTPGIAVRRGLPVRPVTRRNPVAFDPVDVEAASASS